MGKEIKSFLDCLVWIHSAVSEVLGLALMARLTGHMSSGPDHERHTVGEKWALDWLACSFKAFFNKLLALALADREEQSL